MSKKILVVEDDPINRQVMAEFLTAQGFDVVTADDGLAGVERFRAERPDLVIVDALLPYRSGFEVCFELRRLPEGRDVPLLMMSAVCKDTHSTSYATQSLHTQGYLIKPFKMRDLLKTVSSLVGDARAS